jgi:hypothetical protein
MPEDVEMESLVAVCRLHVQTSQSSRRAMGMSWGCLGDDVGESAEVWREAEIEDTTMEGFVQDYYSLGISMSLLFLPGPGHLLVGGTPIPTRV